MVCINASKWPLFILPVVLLSLCAQHASAAPKTDTVVFINGDKLTGEFKSLKRGQLSLNTEATGTIGIEWDKVSNVISGQNIQIETSDGTRYFGILTTAEEDSNIIVMTDVGPQALDPARIISMIPIEGGGRHAWDVEASLGYDFAKAGGVKHATLGLDMDFRSLVRVESLKFNTVITDSDTQDASRRTNLILRHTRLWKNRWFTNSSLSFDQNDELDLKLRSTLGMGGGRYLVQSNTMLLSVEGALQVSREDSLATFEDTDSLEANFAASWDWFLFEDPELDWSTTLQVIPSLTEQGRVRGELDTTFSWEIIGDLKWALSFYGSWDNQPQVDIEVTPNAVSTSDYGVNTALSYDF